MPDEVRFDEMVEWDVLARVHIIWPKPVTYDDKGVPLTFDAGRLQVDIFPVAESEWHFSIGDEQLPAEVREKLIEEVSLDLADRAEP